MCSPLHPPFFTLPPHFPTPRTNHEHADLFIYCGHGAGEKLCDAHRLRRFAVPAALLWGCSSGRLSALGVHDPAGMALSYLVAGAPFVLANLWDVTDKDIDKLSMACMQAVLEGDEKGRGNQSESKVEGEGEPSRTSVGGALSGARGACKLAHAVGCAPVMYGLPCPVICG